MKVSIIGDFHAGAGLNYGKIDPTSGMNTRLIDYENTLNTIIDHNIANKVELIVFLGDIFETRTPPPYQVSIFYKAIKRITDAGIKVIAIQGNHDSSKSKLITSSLDPLKALNLPNTYIFNEIGSIAFDDFNLLLMPYSNRQTYDHKTNSEAIAFLKQQVDVEVAKFNDKPILACLHMMFENTIYADIGDLGINELSIPLSMFDKCAITIAGHIHCHSIIKTEPYVIYSGSTECNGFQEREHNKVFIIYDTALPYENCLEFVPIKTRKFVDLQFDFGSDYDDTSIPNMLKEIKATELEGAIVRVGLKIPETKKNVITPNDIREELYKLNVFCIADITITPIIARQMKNKKAIEELDDLSAFKFYLNSQNDTQDGILVLAEEIIAQVKGKDGAD